MCRIHTAGSKNPSDMFCDRSSKRELSDIQVEIMRHSKDKRNENNRNHTSSHLIVHETNLDEI